MHGLASPLTAPYGGGVAGALPGLGGFALGQTAPGLRGLTTPGLALATVLLVSNLNEEVSHWFNRNWKIRFELSRSCTVHIASDNPTKIL